MSDIRDVWVLVRRSPDPIAIELARAALDIENISSRMRNEMTGSMLPLHQIAIGGFELEVRASDEAAARACLAAHDTSVHDPALDDEGEVEERPVERGADTSEGDAAMRRAAAAAIFGLFVCFGVGGIVALLIVAANAKHALSDRGQTFFAITLLFSAIDLFVLVRFALILTAPS